MLGIGTTNFSSYALYGLLAALAIMAIIQGQWRMASVWAALALVRWLMREGQRYLQDSIALSLSGLFLALFCIAWVIWTAFIQAQYWVLR
jgi:hypothetical protein